VTFKNLGIFSSHGLNWVGWSRLLDPQGSMLVMGDQVGLHELLDVLILGLLQGFNINDFMTFQGSYTGLG
jgi:methyl coenzyme M reductase beta subunit